MELTVSSRLILTYLSQYIIAETDLREAIWQAAVCKFQVLVLASFLAWARDDACSCCETDARIRSRRALGVLFPFPSRVLRFVDEEALINLFHAWSPHLTHALLAFKR